MVDAVVTLVELTGKPLAGGAAVTFRYSDRGFVSLGADTPAHTQYEPLLLDPPIIRRGIEGGDAGAFTLANDGSLDDLTDYTFAGQPVTIRYGAVGAALADYAVLYSGRIERVRIGRQAVEVDIRDSRLLLDKPVAPHVYPGGGGSVNGIPDTTKPRAWGKVYSVRPVRLGGGSMFATVALNTDANGDPAAVTAVNGMFIGWDALSLGSDYADLTNLEAATITAYDYDTCVADGYARLRADRYTVALMMDQCYADIEASNADVAEVLDAVVTDAGLTLNASDKSALASATTAEVGVYVADSEITYSEVLDQLCNSVGAVWYFDASGDVRVKRIAAAAGSVLTLREDPSAGLADGELLINEIDRLPPDPPVWRVRVRYQDAFVTGAPSIRSYTYYNYYRISREMRPGVYYDYQHGYTDTPLRTGIGDPITATRQAVAKGRRAYEDPVFAVASDSAIQTLHGDGAQDVTLQTALYAEADAQAEADRLLALYDAPGERAAIEASYTEATQGDLLGVQPGDTVTVYWDRFGWGAGIDFVVESIEINARLRSVGLGLFLGGVS